ncbi:ABC transporter substrate-binding protein [Actinoplanes utahensis]|nr:LacI family transcriptional regulator [Actinoplanes utahensis]
MTLGAVGLGSMLAGCGDSESAGPRTRPSGPIVLGFSQVGAEGGWRLANTKSIKKAAERNRVKLLFEDAAGDPKKQLEHIQSFIDAKVTAISFSPVVEKGYDDVLRRARDAGIPVILTDRLIDSDPSLYVSSIGAEFVAEGNLAALYLENDYDEEQGGKGSINVVELLGAIGATPTKQRSEGFAATAKRTGRIKIIASESGDWTKAGGEAAIRKVLRRTRKIDAVFAQNDDMGLGAAEVLAAEGLKPGTDIKIVTVDATRAGLEGLVAGKLNYVVECSPLIGEDLMSVVVDLFFGGEVKKRITSDKNVFNKISAAPALEAGREY